MTEYRINGAIGAFLDEYEKANNELIAVVRDLSREELILIRDENTQDEDCRSIQTVLTHIVSAGYTYVNYIRNWNGEKLELKSKMVLDSVAEYEKALLDMMEYTARLFEDYPAIQLEEYIDENKIKTRWGQKYDVEQLLEHAIVHLLRHRRQIQRFLIK